MGCVRQMTDTITQLITEVMRLPEPALQYEFSLRVAAAFPGKYILETRDYDFDLREFARQGLCDVRPDTLCHVQYEARWHGREEGATLFPKNGAFDVTWKGHRLKVVQAEFDYEETQTCIVADCPELAKEFFAAVCRDAFEVRGHILVFSRGKFSRDRSLARQIGDASLDDLILSDAARESLQNDVAEFFQAEDLYRSLGIVWKRGVLLLGPPGNGKTHAVKAMVNTLNKPCLYIRSFNPDRGSIHGCIQNVFARARESAPCILVLEDLDSLVDSRSRSFFLNEMDGLAANHGILTIATTNHPRKLDPAMLERPSRFDRKIHFDLPGRRQRRQFLIRMLSLQKAEGPQISPKQLRRIATSTEGFSYAYLKELCLSGITTWMKERRPGSLSELMMEQVGTLRKQMKDHSPKIGSELTDD